MIMNATAQELYDLITDLANKSEKVSINTLYRMGVKNLGWKVHKIRFYLKYLFDNGFVCWCDSGSLIPHSKLVSTQGSNPYDRE